MNFKTVSKDLIPVWINRPGATARIFDVSRAKYTPQHQDQANKGLITRFENIVQRRHDCIHTCDRPANQPQPIHSAGTVVNVIKDVEYIVEQSNAHIDTEFREWLLTCGFTPVTINQVGY